MISTLTVDPGRACTGWSLFLGTKLATCGLSVLPETPDEGGRWKLGGVARFHYLTIAVACWPGVSNPLPVDRVYVEEMSLNKGRDGTLSKAIATANDLLQLQSIGAFIAGRLGGELLYVPPAKHDKKVTQNRVFKTLEYSELAIVDVALEHHKDSLAHNLYDAVLHGLKAVGRYG